MVEREEKGAEEELWGAPAFGIRQGYEGIALRCGSKEGRQCCHKEVEGRESQAEGLGSC